MKSITGAAISIAGDRVVPAVLTTSRYPSRARPCRGVVPTVVTPSHDAVRTAAGCGVVPAVVTAGGLSAGGVFVAQAAGDHCSCGDGGFDQVHDAVA